MCATSKKVPFVQVFQSILNPEAPVQKFYKSILINSNVDYIKVSISHILKGLVPSPKTSDSFMGAWNPEEGWIKMALSDPLFDHGNIQESEEPGSPDNQSREMA